ncbi:MAG: lytic transglycosylase [Cereibacter sphaeroides]|uniref:Lytic transglycosylase n=1 Tax=Cereibacter sphaeroides TaxID=1063 RepID=A0A2W5S4U9_CERSP|nr:MAG: lytic transglycosylase [Cereibacter sphaeroides]
MLGSSKAIHSATVRDDAALCEFAASAAARKANVPLEVLQTIALAESGRADRGRQRPWPWTVNFGGQGFWFATAEEAELAIAERQSLGVTNFDVGCFQLNHRWHGDAFSSIAAMMNPEQNALYAATFLRRLYEETGSWNEASAAYHSRTPEYAEQYRARLDELRPGIGGTEVVARQNSFPLLQAGSPGGLGSLVPELSGGISLIGSNP